MHLATTALKNVAIFDEHSGAFSVWEQARKKRVFKKGATLLHVDFHSDFAVPNARYMRTSVYAPDIAAISADLDIASFVLPSILRGTFKRFIWLKPFTPCATPCMRTVGSLGGLGLAIERDVPEHLAALVPDARRFRYEEIQTPGKMPKQVDVLDIDLDYFCCRILQNPTAKIALTRAQVQKLRRVSAAKRSQQINLYEGALYLHRPSVWGEVIFNDSEKWIDYALRAFAARRPRAKLVSISRSVTSGFTPEKYAPWIETQLLRYLAKPPRRVVRPAIEGYAPFPFVFTKGALVYQQILDSAYRFDGVWRIVWEEVSAGTDIGRIIAKVGSAATVEEVLLGLKERLLLDLR